jgi:hypothetical protein
MEINSFNILMDSVEYFAKLKNPLILKNWFIGLKVELFNFSKFKIRSSVGFSKTDAFV